MSKVLIPGPAVTPVPGPAVTPVPDLAGSPGGIGLTITSLIVGLPLAALVVGATGLWGLGPSLRDVVLATVLFAVTGHAVVIGFHRMLAHRAFVASRPLKIVLVVLGSMAFQGGPIGWVATHRRHHVFADEAGDPHSPRPMTPGAAGYLRGLGHAHLGWLFTDRGEPARKRAADLRGDHDLVVIDRLFPWLCVASLAIPFGLGWLLGGSLTSAFTALVWAGLVRVLLLHHITWSVNSVGHMYGRRPFATSDRSRNVAVLAVLSFGDSWHNGHHAFPRSARHGLLPGQVDSSAFLIRCFSRLGWVHDVHVPDDEALRARLAPR